MSKTTDVLYGRRGGRMADSFDVDQVLAEVAALRALRERTAEAEAAEPVQLDLFGGAS